MGNKILTISIAAYNMQDYLSRCLDSIVCSEVIDAIEILIINDGSKDNTLKIAQEYQNNFPQSIIAVDKPNGGHGSTINKGIELAKGKYFKLLDADDWFDSEQFVKFVKQLQQTECDLIITPYSKEFVFTNKSEYHGYKNVKYNKKYDFQTSREIQNCGVEWFDLPAITYKTEILKKNGIKISECFYCDIEYDCYPLKYVNTIIFFDYCVYKYFIGREGQSISPEGSTRNYPHHLTITKNMIAFYLQNKNGMLNSDRIIQKATVAKVVHNYVVLMKFYLIRDNADILLKEFDHFLSKESSVIYDAAKNKLRLLKIMRPIGVWRNTNYNIYQNSLFKYAYKILKK